MHPLTIRKTSDDKLAGGSCCRSSIAARAEFSEAGVPTQGDAAVRDRNERWRPDAEHVPSTTH